MKDYVESFVAYISNALLVCDVYLIFDRYLVFSIKSYTRSSRADNLSSRDTELIMETDMSPQRVCLVATHNKIQLIKMICDYLEQQCETSSDRKLVITSAKEIPVQLCGSTVPQRPDLSTLHEKADGIIAQQATSTWPDPDTKT